MKKDINSKEREKLDKAERKWMDEKKKSDAENNGNGNNLK